MGVGGAKEEDASWLLIVVGVAYWSGRFEGDLEVGVYSGFTLGVSKDSN